MTLFSMASMVKIEGYKDNLFAYKFLSSIKNTRISIQTKIMSNKNIFLFYILFQSHHIKNILRYVEQNFFR